jgi:hypothetical protein
LKKGPHFKTRKVLEGIKLWSWVQTGTETKIDSAGEGQQQFTRADIHHIMALTLEKATVSKTSDDNSILSRLILQEDLIIYLMINIYFLAKQVTRVAPVQW